jgi:hypothetical protein
VFIQFGSHLAGAGRQLLDCQLRGARDQGLHRSIRGIIAQPGVDRIGGIQPEPARGHGEAQWRLGRQSADPHEGARVACRCAGDFLHQLLGGARTQALSETRMTQLVPRPVRDLGGHRGRLRVDGTPLRREGALSIEQRQVAQLTHRDRGENGEGHALILPRIEHMY